MHRVLHRHTGAVAFTKTTDTMKKASIIILAMALGCGNQQSAPQNEAAVETVVEQLRMALLNPSNRTLQALTAPQLTYGHSNGLIEDRETCITSMVSGKYKFLTLTFSEQTVDVVGNTAIVRHRMYADTHDEGKAPGTASLHVMQVWQHTADGWKLLARQAVKIPPVTP